MEAYTFHFRFLQVPIPRYLLLEVYWVFKQCMIGRDKIINMSLYVWSRLASDHLCAVKSAGLTIAVFRTASPKIRDSVH